MPQPLKPTAPPPKHQAKLSGTSPIVLAVVVAVVALLVGWFVLLRPQWEQLSSIPDPATYVAAKSAIITQRAALKKLRDEYAKLTSTDFTRLDLFLPKGKDVPTLLAQLEGLAKYTGFQLVSLGISEEKVNRESSNRVIRNEEGEAIGVNTIGESQPALSLQDLQLTLTLGPGTYDQLKKFIATTEESLRLLRLVSLTFTNKLSSGATSYSMNFRSYYLQ